MLYVFMYLLYVGYLSKNNVKNIFWEIIYKYIKSKIKK